MAIELGIEGLHQQPVPELRPFLKDCRVGEGRVKVGHVILRCHSNLVDGVVGTGMFHLHHDVGVDKVGADHARTKWSVGILK